MLYFAFESNGGMFFGSWGMGLVVHFQSPVNHRDGSVIEDYPSDIHGDTL